jgi:hypothetical protein
MILNRLKIIFTIALLSENIGKIKIIFSISIKANYFDKIRRQIGAITGNLLWRKPSILCRSTTYRMLVSNCAGIHMVLFTLAILLGLCWPDQTTIQSEFNL